jgi:hypothetical protein
MKHRRTAAIAAAIALLAGTAWSQEAGKPLKPKDQAKIYERTLQEMTGQSLNAVVEVIDGWKFQALAAWEAVDPTAKDVASHDRNKIKFSKKEYATIFGEGGAFKVVVYTKLVKTETTTMGSVDSMGMSGGKDTTLTVEKYAVIRAVFKDDKLLVFRVWPTMDQGGVAGGMMYRR